MNFATAQEFYDFCVDHKACKEGLVEIKGLTLAEWWDKTNRGDWMLWLRDEGVWDFTPVQLAEYRAHHGPGVGRIQAHHGTGVGRIQAHRGTGVGRIQAHHGIGVGRIQAHHGPGVGRIQAHHGIGVGRIQAHHGPGVGRIRSHHGTGVGRIRPHHGTGNPRDYRQPVQGIDIRLAGEENKWQTTRQTL